MFLATNVDIVTWSSERQKMYLKLTCGQFPNTRSFLQSFIYRVNLTKSWQRFERIKIFKLLWQLPYTHFHNLIKLKNVRTIKGNYNNKLLFKGRPLFSIFVF